MNSRVAACVLLAFMAFAAIAEARHCRYTDYSESPTGTYNQIISTGVHAAKPCKVALLNAWASKNPAAKTAWYWPNGPYTHSNHFTGFVSWVALAPWEADFIAYQKLPGSCYLYQLGVVTATRREVDPCKF